LILAALGALTLSACVDPNAYPEDPNARTKSGAIIGGMLGAVAGVAVSGDGDELTGAILGGALGAATGFVPLATLTTGSALTTATSSKGQQQQQRRQAPTGEHQK
jgi:hypothetical protein